MIPGRNPVVNKLDGLETATQEQTSFLYAIGSQLEELNISLNRQEEMLASFFAITTILLIPISLASLIYLDEKLFNSKLAELIRGLLLGYL